MKISVTKSSTRCPSTTNYYGLAAKKPFLKAAHKIPSLCKSLASLLIDDHAIVRFFFVMAILVFESEPM